MMRRIVKARRRQKQFNSPYATFFTPLLPMGGLTYFLSPLGTNYSEFLKASKISSAWNTGILEYVLTLLFPSELSHPPTFQHIVLPLYKAYQARFSIV